MVNVNLGLTYAASNYKANLFAVPSTGVNATGGLDLEHAAVQLWLRHARHGDLRLDAVLHRLQRLEPPQHGTPVRQRRIWQITDGITNTPFTISFCLTTTRGSRRGGVHPDVHRPAQQ